MNIKEIDERYITQKVNDSFYVEVQVKENNPLFLEIKEATNFDYPKMEEWVRNKFGFDEHHYQNCLMNGIGYYGDKSKTDTIYMLKNVPDGFKCSVQYKKVKMSFNVMPDGTIAKAFVIHEFFGTLMQGYKEIGVRHETLDEFYASAINEIKKDKRRIMTHFNKLIKETKAEYRDRLKEVNAILKGDE